MNLFQLLTHIPHEQMQRIAEEFGLSFTPSKRNLLQAIAQRYRDRGFMRAVFEDVTYEARGLLRTLVLFAPRDAETFTLQDAWAQAWTETRSLNELLEELGHVGLLFSHEYREQGKVILPVEIRQLVQELLADQFILPEPPRLHEPVRNATRSTSVEAVFALLCVLQHSRVKRTQKGNPHKRLLESWMQRVQDGSAQETSMDFALEYAVQRQLIVPMEETYELTEAITPWLQKPLSELQRDVWHYIRDAYVMPRRFLHALVAMLFYIAETDEKAQVISVPAFRKALETNTWEQERAEWNDEDFHFALLLIYNAGVIEMDDPAEPGVFRLTEIGQSCLSQQWQETVPAEGQECVLQPNFDMLVPPTYGLSTLWRLDQLAEMKRRDVMTEFHLTQDRVINAMRRGWDKDSVLSFLDELTKHRIPDLVAFSLNEWCSRYGRVQFMPTVVVECDTAELAEEIFHIPDVQSQVQQRISPTHFIIEPDRAARLFRLLRERGYEPSASGELTVRPAKT